MRKTVVIFLLLLALAILFVTDIYAKNERGTPAPISTSTSTAQASPTLTPVTCIVNTGLAGGTVNLRECQGAACGRVLDILTEGTSLTIVSTGEYFNVTTKSGVTGWLSKKYCEVKP